MNQRVGRLLRLALSAIIRLFPARSGTTRVQEIGRFTSVDRIGENPNAPLVYSLGRRGTAVLEVSARKDG